MSKNTLSPEQLAFVDQLSALLMPWGMATGVARLYAYLLLQGEPVSLDRICDELEVSKSTASVAARNLEGANMIRRHTVRGSKRVLYSSVQDISAKMMEHAEMLGRFAALLQQQPAIVDNPGALQNMVSYGDFCLFMQKTITHALAEWERLQPNR